MPSLKKENIYSDNQSRISTHEKGVFGEDKACSFLLSKGYEIIERNFRVRNGEIDIIALKGEYLVFVEVKSFLDGDIDTLAQELNEKKQKKIIKTSKIFLEKHRQYNSKYIRYDVIALNVKQMEAVHHIENAFTE